MNFLRSCALATFILVLSGCDTGLRQMGATESGLVFRRLPTFLGGGLSTSVISPKQRVVIWPWDTVYRFDTSQKTISWGAERARTEGGEARESEEVYIRSSDGNEVALKITVRYQISGEADKLARLIQEVAVNDDEVRSLVMTVARADIRTFMSELSTAEFKNPKRPYEAADRVRDQMNKRLANYGIQVLTVTTDAFKFERKRRDGSLDSRYQEMLNTVQEKAEETKKEHARILTVKSGKESEFQREKRSYEMLVSKASGLLEQAKLRGDAYFRIKQNEAQGIRAAGEAEVKGLIEQVQALNGPGGRALLRLELARALLKSDPRFVVLDQAGSASGGSLSLNKTDTNKLLEQMGLIEALQAEPAKQLPARAQATPASDSQALGQPAETGQSAETSTGLPERSQTAQEMRSEKPPTTK